MLRRINDVLRDVNENDHLLAQVNTKHLCLLGSAIHAKPRVQLLPSIPCHPAGLLPCMGHPPNPVLSFFFSAELMLEGKSV